MPPSLITFVYVRTVAGRAARGGARRCPRTWSSASATRLRFVMNHAVAGYAALAVMPR